VDITVLGSCGSWPGPGAACSGYLVRHAGTAVVLDLGSGTMANLQRHLDLGDLDAVVLTHEHPDHWVDVTGLGVALRYGLGRDEVPLLGTAGVLERAEVALDGLRPPFAPRPLTDGDEVTIGALRLRFSATDHSVPTLAVRVDALAGAPSTGTADSVSEPTTDKTRSTVASLVYSSDTGPGWSLAALGSGVDLGVCEATVLHAERRPGLSHLSAHQAGAMAADAQARALLITHLAPGTDPVAAAAEASAAFGAPVRVAVEGETVEVA
jgi:ribonuclease BN (tRNA processing enzyme)